MITTQIVILKEDTRKEFLKKFIDLESFNIYKNKVLNNCIFIKYKIKEGKYYSDFIIEYGNTNEKNYKYRPDNKHQQNSRINNLALQKNKLINLSFTPAKQQKVLRYIKNKPLTSDEIKILKSMIHYKTLSVGQYNLIDEILSKSDRRVKL